jgi:HK97 family phage portal protein
MLSLLLRGNFYGLVVARSAAERPTQIEPLNPDRVTVTVEPDRRTVTYRLDGQQIDREDLHHVRAYRMPGSVVGASPIRYHAETIGLGLAAQAFGAKFFGDNATPAGVLTSDQALNQSQASDLAERWKATRSGRRGTAVLGAGTKFQPISVNPEESQFLESQRFTVQQVARVFRVPPELIGADSGSAMTYSNIESRDLTLLKYAVNPWLVKLERTMTSLLPRGTYCKFNRGQLLEADLLTRYQSYEIGLRAGFLTLPEVRELEDREPLPATPAPGAPPQLGSVA